MSISSQVSPVTSKPSSSKAPTPLPVLPNARKKSVQKNVPNVKQKEKTDLDGFATPKKIVKTCFFKSGN